MKKEMLINVLQPEECRIAIVEDGVLEELYVERTSHESYTGNIYKGKIVNLEPAIQAAFVDFSVGRNGFLHVSDVEPQYYSRLVGDDTELGARDRGREPARDRPRDEPRPAGRAEGRPPRTPPPPPEPEEEDPRERDRDWDWDRPDRSEKGRRDRSDRRFGEGLLEDWELPPPPPPPQPVAPPPPPPAPPREEPRRPAFEAEETIGWGTRRPAIEMEAAEVHDEGDELRGRTARTPAPADPVEEYLPPSRTHRSRGPAAPRHAAADLDIDEEIATTRREPEPEARISEPRRGRGRGRGSRSPEREPEPEPETLLDPKLPTEPFGPSAGLEADLDTPLEPRRRGGRDAIRARAGGGEREPARPRERDPERERPRRFEPEREAEPIEAERRPIEPERRPIEREFEPPPARTRGRSAAAERPRGAEPTGRAERPGKVGRAGEPGYVPRRERARPGDAPLGGEPPADPFRWAEPEPHDLDDLDLEPGDEAASEAGDIEPGKDKDGRRRRRRRRRRPDREPGAAPAAGRAPADEDEADFPPARPAAGVADDLIDDLDFDEDAGLHDEDDERRPAGTRAAVVDEDDEIDPELEEEIRREIEEIAEIEREMGLRGPAEARPRRGEPREPEGPRGAGRAPRGRGATKPPIQEIFRRGDEVLVQVIKESIGTKGPTLSTYLSIPGRYLVLMPGLNRVGVSRKIADEGQRRRLREIMNALNPPKGLGFIVRTAGLDRSKRELARDMAYLLRLWKVILRRIRKTKAPTPIYQESDMITRTIRDIFNSEIDTIWIDEPQAFERAQEFLRVVMPKFVNRLKLYDEKVPLFHKYGLEEEIARIQRRRVDLVGGGSIVIDQTEALVAIDVNSGNFRVEDDAEKTAYEMNLRAAKEIARQLRLRDLGGVICNDFIDMRDERNRRGVERALRDAVKRDRARTKILRMSQFGIIEMTRQRIRPSLKRSVYEDCTHCGGAGVVKTAESMAIDVMRLLALASHREEIRRMNISVCPAVATYLNNRKRRDIARIEAEARMLISIRAEEDAPAEHLQVDCFDAANAEVRLIAAPPPPPRRGR